MSEENKVNDNELGARIQKMEVVFVDTSAVGTKQCEAITNVAIRIMRIKGMDEQRKIKIDCVII